MRRFAILAIALALQTGPAVAQLGGLGLPQVQLPSLPSAGQSVSRTVEGVEATVRDLPQTTNAQIRSLLRLHRDLIDRDPQGFPIVRGEVLAIAPNAAALSAARAIGFAIERTDTIDGVGDLVTLRAPDGLGASAALQRLRRADPQGVYDLDHIHLLAGMGAVAPAQPAGAALVRGARIGLIDGGVGAHPSLAGVVAEQRPFSSASIVTTAHATAIASLLAGHGAGVEGAAPGAQIYVADIYGGQPTGGSAAALVRALSWLASGGVPVINVSLVGPRNRIVEAIVERLVARGFVIVAAVGNDGPAAPPLFPASYAGVVGVTGVDLNRRVLIEAAQGPQVEFAAPGMPVAASGSGVARVRGTSYAAPIVAGLLATRMAAADPVQAETAIASLRNEARDLGAHGRDNVYGYGLVGANFLLTSAR
ncbi:MAG: S8 family serine peptidase [Proteobacteria bacterium]|nr:S8 family serine peptidase [Pseudomonadota bacterium]